MTRKEEELLKALSLSIERLKLCTERQQQAIATLQKENARLESLRKDLHKMNEELRTKNDLLLSSRLIVADDGDWLKARKRLEDLRNNILQGIKLLETE